MKTILALETSCDETGVAILRGRNGDSGSDLLASEVASQIAAHEKYGGIVPEIASRNHLVYAPRLLEGAASKAKIRLSEVDGFAATSGPGLASSLMIGASIAKGLAIGFGKPYLAINHLEGHLLSPFFGDVENGDQIPPNVSLIVSGGHTMLALAKHSIRSLRYWALDIPAGRRSKNTRETGIQIVLIYRAACLSRKTLASVD